jgi:hypothetical protein
VNRPARSKLSPRFHALGDQRDLAVVAVDLGYSSSRSSCGVATSGGAEPKHYTFGDAVSAVATLCNGRVAPVLVLEAPLSTSHCDRGNPRIREVRGLVELALRSQRDRIEPEAERAGPIIW